MASQGAEVIASLQRVPVMSRSAVERGRGDPLAESVEDQDYRRSMYSRTCSCANPFDADGASVRTVSRGWMRNISGKMTMATMMLPCAGIRGVPCGTCPDAPLAYAHLLLASWSWLTSSRQTSSSEWRDSLIDSTSAPAATRARVAAGKPSQRLSDHD
jgi:hypothetical protein